MLILILIDVQYAVFSFEKGSNRQNHSSCSCHLVKKSSPAKFLIPPTGGNLPPPPTLPLFGKPGCYMLNVASV